MAIAVMTGNTGKYTYFQVFLCKKLDQQIDHMLERLVLIDAASFRIQACRYLR